MFVEVHSARHQAFKVTECTSTRIGNLTIVSCTQKAMYRNVSSYRIASIRIHHQLRIELYRSEFNYMSNKTNSKALNVEASKRYCNRGGNYLYGIFWQSHCQQLSFWMEQFKHSTLKGYLLHSAFFCFC